MHPAPSPERRHRFPFALAPAILLVAAIVQGELPAFCGHDGAAGSSLATASRPDREAILSFDAAWTAEGATEILDILDRMNVTANFFLAGRFIESEPAIVRRIVAAGHEVGNHTWHHGHLTRLAIDGTNATLPGVTRSALLREIAETDRVFLRATGRSLTPIWRAPFGEINREVLRWTRDEGYTHVGWSSGLDTLDWVSDRASSLYSSPERTVRRILERLGRRPSGSGPAVILMHLGSTRPPAERFSRALPALIEGCRDLGYRLVTVGETAPGDPLP
jgi:peptidoglycan/xylan/chitin deacetylase (PgdA/CDA1 family)